MSRRTDRFDEEMEAHAAMLADEFIARGMTAEQAAQAARRELGNATSLRERYRDQSGMPRLEAAWRDVRYAFRTLRRSPAFTGASVATLSLGMAGMILTAGVVSTVLWKPLPFPEPARLVMVREIDPRQGSWPFSEPALKDLAERSRSLASVAAYRAVTVALTGTGEAESIRAAQVTPSFFATLGIVPVAGRVFEAPQGSVVIGRSLWRRKWQDNPGLIGQAILIDGQPHTIAGVADLPGELLPGAEIVTPLAPRAVESRSAHDIEAVARLAGGVSLGQAQAELNGLATLLGREHPASNAGWGMQAVALSEFILSPRAVRTIWMIFAAVALVWLLACVNVAALQMARGVARQREMNTRRALGASAGRLLSQKIIESAVLSAASAIAGLAIAAFGAQAVVRFAADAVPQLARLQIDGATAAIAAGCLALSTALFGLAGGKRGRDGLVVAQVAMASVLLLGATLLFQSFLRLQAVDPGFDPARLLAVRVNLPAGYDYARRVTFFREASERLELLPGIESAGATNVPPFAGYGTANRFRVEGEGTAASEYRSAAWRAVTPGFFAATRLPLKQGRLFTEADGDGALETVILSESMARRYWPGQDPVGKRLLWGRSGNPKTIVGVVGDLRDLAVDAPPVPTMFRPYAQLTDPPMTMLVRASGDPGALAASVRREIQAVDRNVPLEFQTLRAAMTGSLFRQRAGLLSLAAFALAALIIAASGLYGVVNYRVAQRRREIGLRLALGAQPAALQWSVQRRCLLLAGAGLAIGLPLAFALSRFIASLLYDTEPASPGPYAVVALLLAIVALAASYGPARRAAKLDPLTAIRHE